MATQNSVNNVAPTQANNDNSTKIATTAYVLIQASVINTFTWAANGGL